MFEKPKTLYARFFQKRQLKKIERNQRMPNERGWRYVVTKLGTFYAGSIYNDLRFGKKKHIRLGKTELLDRAAIYLIFPTNGLLQSHLDSLRYLRSKGYATIVVSNVKLTEADSALLLDGAFLVIERYNYGYDFGGYRDGILALEPHLKKLKYLALFNDSCWFPITSHVDWLNEAEKMGLDYVGAASHFGMPRPKVAEFRNLEWKYATDHHFFHYASYALLISSTILKDQDFWRFWKKFPMTNIKRLVIRRGETGLTQWVIHKGYSHGSTLNLATINADIHCLSRSELELMVKKLLICADEPELQKIKEEVMTATLSSNSAMANLILLSILIQGVSYAVGEYLIVHQRFGFLKKSPLWLSSESSRLMLEFIEDLEGEIGSHVRNEASALAGSAPKSALQLET